MIDFFCLHEALSDYAAPVLEASKIVEEMTILILSENGYTYENGRIEKEGISPAIDNSFKNKLISWGKVDSTSTGDK